MPTFDDYITDTLMRDLVGHDRKPVSFLVYLWLAAEQARASKLQRRPTRCEVRGASLFGT
jgi:hypothetical protein